MIKIKRLHFLFRLNNKLANRYLNKGDTEKYKKHFRKCIYIRNKIEGIIENNK